jgi:hypothetical protein
MSPVLCTCILPTGPFHSIIGNRGLEKILLKDSSDGVVPYSPVW